MSLVAVKNKYQVVIPQKVREQIGLNVGDVLDAKIERGKITLTPRSPVDQGIAEGLEDMRKGRTHGPYKSVEEASKAFRAGALRTKSVKRPG